jgi:serine protease inhibitor
VPVATSSVTGFGLRLLEQLGPGPVAFSPLSVHACLATFRQGTSGDTRAALDAVLGEDGPPVGVEDPAIRLALAQALWLDPRYRLVPAFSEAAERRGVDCRSLDFGDPGAPAEVNTWAAERTEGMIEQVVGSFEPDEVMALADAAYFEGSWTEPFRRELSEERPFTRPDGSVVPVPTMLGAAHTYFEDEHVRAVRLHYGNELELSFVAMIAREGLDAPAPDEARWAEIVDGLERRHGQVALPRLRLASGLKLEAPLTALGLGAMFRPAGDLDGMFEGPEPAKGVSRVLHEARVDLDEEGTRAAAVTIETVQAVSLPADPPFDLRLDRPFLWAIEHRESGTLLFLGRVTDPSTSEEST